MSRDRRTKIVRDLGSSIELHLEQVTCKKEGEEEIALAIIVNSRDTGEREVRRGVRKGVR
jgi:hypothetical protein